MKNLFRFSLVISFLFISVALSAQTSVANLDKAYGLDPLLYNGKYYTYFLPAWTEGTQFLNGPDYQNGFVTIRGVRYDDLRLNYDIFNQQLILKYKTSAGIDKQIIITDTWLETFNLGSAHFERLRLQDTVTRIYQVIGNGPNRILYFWSKELVPDNRMGNTNYVFAPSKRKSYLLMGSKLLEYKKNNSFIAFFEPAKQTVLKKYLHQRKIKMKKASDQVVTELINYCNTLLTQ